MLKLNQLSTVKGGRFFMILLMLGLLLPISSALAQTEGPGSFEKQQPVIVPSNQSSIEGANVGALAGTNLIQDPSFEASFGSELYWSQFSTNFGTPVCPSTAPGPAGCGNGDGTAGPRTGSAWVWFGGTTFSEYSIVSQSVTIPMGCSATLQFYLWIGAAGPGSDASDSFGVLIDLLGPPVFQVNATQISSYTTYKLVSIDLSSYADGNPHTIDLISGTDGQIVNFNLDDVSLVMGNCNISGNVGVSGVTLNYTDGTPMTAISNLNGSYTLSVSNNWSGVVTPSHPCYTFSPANRSYSNVITHRTAQNYTPTFNNAPVCAVTAGVFRPSNGLLYLKNSNTTGFADISINYGLGGDYPVTGDWDGDGDDTIGVYRGGLFYLRNANTIGFADLVFPFGQPGDQPVAGDWDGDGDDTIGVYRSSTGTFYLRNSNSTGAPGMIFSLGIPGDVGIAGDWDGDGDDTTGVFRPGNGALYLKNTNATGFADIQINYGLPGDRPVTGDWNNDGKDTIGIYRNGAFYLRNSNTIGFADIVFALGVPGDMPIAGNWDGIP